MSHGRKIAVIGLGYVGLPVAVAFARSGVGVVDAVRIYSHVRFAQTLLRKPFPASMIVYKLRDPDRAPALAQTFERLFQHDRDSATPA